MLVTKRILASDTSFATPYYVVKAKQPGPVFMVVSGIHGNETASIAAAQLVVTLMKQRKLFMDCGTLIVIPKVNKEAYRKGIRGIPDLNRTFPRKSNSAASHPLAAAVFQITRSYRPSWYLDLHEANGLSQLNSKRLGQSLIVNAQSRSLPVVRSIIKKMNRTIAVPAHHFNIRLRERPGSSRIAVSRILGARAITVETCWSLERSKRINYQKDIVCHFLRAAGLMK